MIIIVKRILATIPVVLGTTLPAIIPWLVPSNKV